MGEIKTRHLAGDKEAIMKTTLNLGALNFNFGDSSASLDSKKTAALEIKDISVTFEALVEETLADIQASLECVKELKNLGSEIANLFAGLEEKKEARREKEMEEKFESYKAQ